MLPLHRRFLIRPRNTKLLLVICGTVPEAGIPGCKRWPLRVLVYKDSDPSAIVEPSNQFFQHRQIHQVLHISTR
jgi:hypothetical protein